MIQNKTGINISLCPWLAENCSRTWLFWQHSNVSDGSSLPDVLIKDSKWTKLYFGEGQAALSFTHLNKDDEGLYTLRMVSRGGISECSAYLFVRGKPLI